MDKQAAEIWSADDAFATCLLTLGVDRYGLSAINWAPQTWAQEIGDDCSVALPQRNADKLAAACALLVHPDEFYFSPASFTDIITGLASEWFDTSVWHPPTAHECAWGVVEAHLLNPPDEKEEFSPEVIRYVNMLVRNDGYPALPHVFTQFGIPKDPYLPDSHDYAGDPDLEAATLSGTEERENDISQWISSQLLALGAGLSQLPLRKKDTISAVVNQLRQAAQSS